MNEAAGRWRLVDAEMSSGWTPELNGRPVEWTDLADDQFITGPRAWQAARAGKSDPERHVVAPDLDVPALRGCPYLAHNAIHDLAALNKTEMLLWDVWGMQLGHGPGPVPEADAALLDEVCARTADPGVSRRHRRACRPRRVPRPANRHQLRPLRRPAARGNRTRVTGLACGGSSGGAPWKLRALRCAGHHGDMISNRKGGDALAR